MTKMLLVVSGKYPHIGPLTSKYRIFSFNTLNVPPAPALSAYHGCVIWRCVVQSLWMSRRIPMQPRESVPISHWKFDLPDYLAWIISYICSIKGFLKSLPMNYDPWSYIVYVGQVYMVNHVVSTKFAIFIARLSLYCIILKHPVMR